MEIRKEILNENGYIQVSRKYLSSLGVKPDALRKAIQRGNIKESKSGFIVYSSISEAIKSRYKLPSEDYLAKLLEAGDKAEKPVFLGIGELVKQHISADSVAYFNALMKPKEAAEAVHKDAIFRLFKALRGRNNQDRTALGINSQEELLELICNHIQKEGYKMPSKPKSFEVWFVSVYAKRGAESLSNAKKENNNAEKFQAWHKAIAVALYAKVAEDSGIKLLIPEAYKRYCGAVLELVEKWRMKGYLEARTTARGVRHFATQPIFNESTGFIILDEGDKVQTEPVSISAFKALLSGTNQVVSGAIAEMRHGKKAARKHSTYVPTAKPLYRNMLVSADGYHNNFYLGGKYQTCYTYVVFDSCTGVPIGMATGLTETAELQKAAFLDAIRYCGGRGFMEVECDGNNVGEWLTETGIALKVTVRNNPEGEGSNLAFKNLQDKYWRNMPGYTGHNVKTKKDASQQHDAFKGLKNYPFITPELIHNEWKEIRTKEAMYKPDALICPAAPTMTAEKMARAFGYHSQASIRRDFVEVRRTLYEVDATMLYKSGKMPKDLVVQAYIWENVAHIFTESGDYIASCPETERAYKHQDSDKTALGHHLKRAKQNELARKAAADALLESLPDDAEQVIRLANQPDFWNKKAESAILDKFSEASAPKTDPDKKINRFKR